MKLTSRLFAYGRIVLGAASFLSLASGAAAETPYANPFERSAFGDDWGILSNDVFFGGAYNLFGLSPASRTLWLTDTAESKTTSESNAIANAASSSENLFSFASSLSPSFGVSRGRGNGAAAPNALTAVIEWANTTATFSAGTSWIGGNPPANDLTTDIGAFGSAGSAPVNPNLTAGRSINGLSFLSGAFSYTIESTTGSALLIGSSGISNSATNTQTFGSGILLRISISQTWINNGGALIFNGSVNIIQTGTTRTLTIDGSGNTTFNGVVQNTASGSTGSLAKTGAGTLILSNANTYNGSTSVSGGTLLVTNTAGSATGTSSVVVTNAGTTLSGGTTNGTGGISGPLGINPSATLSPGTSGTGAGTTAILNTGALTLVSASNFNIDLNSLTAGTGYDQLDVTGTVNVSGSNLSVAVGGMLTLGDKFFITLNDGTDLVTGTFAQVGTVTANNGYVFLISYLDNGDGGLIGNDISLTVTAIPEPSTWLGAGLALAAVGFMQRRRLRGLINRNA